MKILNSFLIVELVEDLDNIIWYPGTEWTIGHQVRVAKLITCGEQVNSIIHHLLIDQSKIIAYTSPNQVLIHSSAIISRYDLNKHIPLAMPKIGSDLVLKVDDDELPDNIIPNLPVDNKTVIYGKVVDLFIYDDKYIEKKCICVIVNDDNTQYKNVIKLSSNYGQFVIIDQDSLSMIMD